MPDFDRWGYWEKFDYWAVFWGMCIMGSTGLLMGYSIFFTRFVPGWTLNVAFWIHRIEALLAMTHIFTMHFFVSHLRRHNFPMDLSIFEGSVGAEALRHEKKAWLVRLKKSGLYEKTISTESNGIQKNFYRLIGYSALAAGLFLLVGSAVNIKNIAW